MSHADTLRAACEPRYDAQRHNQKRVDSDPAGIRDAASLFQLACDVFNSGRYRILQ